MKFNFISKRTQRVNKTKFKEDVDGMKKEFTANTMADIAINIPFGSTVKFIFYYNKIWANRRPNDGDTMINYGIGFKIVAMVVKKFERIPNDVFLTNNFGYLCDKQSLKNKYKKYIDEKRKHINKNISITI
ncbi:hypothetical protein QJ857_gp0951 [Tupanvirus soda lake]|uniref:Uncharacterized protein n=2 Tax=Tupanvirus TaxID=2094720 RepID=A0A6N1NUK5_9VIRU|nr:hypothetical protein QJ857_gp0951 [Tupanvirus soda lake]QKU35103.1 hypothetical protein [Tupanvirus soda lake]